VILLAAKGQFALAFGTGDREDLWNPARANEEGRFYVILDEGYSNSVPPPAGQPSLPRIEADYPAANRFVATDPIERLDLLSDPLASPGTSGYVIQLGPSEKVTTKAFAVSGVLVFSSFVPSEGGGETCFFEGESNVFTIFTLSGNGLPSVQGTAPGGRYRTIEGLGANPFVETSGGDPDATGETGDDLTQDLIDINEELRKSFPPTCKFANTTINIKIPRSDTGIEFVAPVPQCVIPMNWKEQ
jgi:hypothetical protein